MIKKNIDDTNSKNKNNENEKKNINVYINKINVIKNELLHKEKISFDEVLASPTLSVISPIHNKRIRSLSSTSSTTASNENNNPNNLNNDDKKKQITHKKQLKT